MEEISGIASVECLTQVWFEGVLALSHRGTTVLVRMLADDGIQSLTIGGRHILDIRGILQTAFDLKRHSTCFNEFKEMIALVHILQRQQITVAHYLAIRCIQQREAHPTELGTLPSVGTATKAILRSITKSGVADAQRTMDKDFEFHLRNILMDLRNLFGG